MPTIDAYEGLAEVIQHPAAVAAARTERQLRASRAAQALAPQLYLAWARLGLVATSWSELQPLQRERVYDIAAMAIRLGDPLVVDTAAAHVASMLRHDGRREGLQASAPAWYALAKTAVLTAMRHFAGRGVA